MTRPKCKWENCPQSAWGGTDYCYGHNQHLEKLERLKDQPKKPLGRPRVNVGSCKTEGCTRKAEVKGYCKSCDQRIRRQFG